jgi:hypothetical protein
VHRTAPTPQPELVCTLHHLLPLLQGLLQSQQLLLLMVNLQIRKVQFANSVDHLILQGELALLLLSLAPYNPQE